MVTITSQERFFIDYPVRITSVTENEDFTLEIEAESFPWGTQSPTIHPKQTLNAFLPGYFALAGDVNVPVFFEATPQMTQNKGYNS